MKSIFYWSPFLTNVATISAVIESATSLKKFSKKYEPFIIDACGEFEKYKEDFLEREIQIIRLTPFNYFKLLPKTGFFKSRFSYIAIFIISLVPLLFLLKKRKPDYFVSHLITSLPIFLGFIFKFKTKFILRISGLPKLNKLRFFYWKIFGKNIHIITTPTNATLNELRKLKLFDQNKIYLLKDPIIDIRKICSYKKESIEVQFNKKNFIVSIGRLTVQKNFDFLIKSIAEILKIEKNLFLLIIGDGEQKVKLENLILNHGLKDKIKLIGFRKNIFKYLSKAKLFILSSLWEDPGWVLLEAAACNIPILSSNCKNGPSEILKNDVAGILFDSNSKNDFKKKFNTFICTDRDEINKKKIAAKRKALEYTKFRHYLELNKIIN